MFEAQAWFQHGSSMPMLEFHGRVVGYKLTSVSSIYIYMYIYIYIYIHIYIYLEPEWPLFSRFWPIKLKVNHPKEGSFGFQVCIYIYIYISLSLSLRCVYDNAHATSQCVTDIQNKSRISGSQESVEIYSVNLVHPQPNRDPTYCFHNIFKCWICYLMVSMALSATPCCGHQQFRLSPAIRSWHSEHSDIAHVWNEWEIMSSRLKYECWIVLSKSHHVGGI